jgi:hypothetical protein
VLHEDVVESQQSHSGLLGISCCLWSERSQLLLGLVGATLEMSGLCRREAGLEPGAGVDGGPGQAFAEGVVVAGTGERRPRDKELGAAGATHEPECRHFQGVCLVACIDGLDHIGQ